MVKNGDRVKDLVTGFEGIVTSYSTCLTGCDRIYLAPPVDKDGKNRDGYWTDAHAVKLIKAGAVVIDDAKAMPKGRTGGPPSRIK